MGRDIRTIEAALDLGEEVEGVVKIVQVAITGEREEGRVAQVAMTRADGGDGAHIVPNHRQECPRHLHRLHPAKMKR